MPRRYLTVMNLLWAFGCLPLAVFGLTDQIWVMAIAAFLVGAAFNGGVVIWGTLLQRRVPAEMLGRVSSLDFFVSLAFMPVSMAFAGPAGESLGLPVVFLIAGLAPLVIGVVAIIAARMTRDEIAHPLDASNEDSDVVSDDLGDELPTLVTVEGQTWLRPQRPDRGERVLSQTSSTRARMPGADASRASRVRSGASVSSARATYAAS